MDTIDMSKFSSRDSELLWKDVVDEEMPILNHQDQNLNRMERDIALKSNLETLILADVVTEEDIFGPRSICPPKVELQFCNGYLYVNGIQSSVPESSVRDLCTNKKALEIYQEAVTCAVDVLTKKLSVLFNRGEK